MTYTESDKMAILYTQRVKMWLLGAGAWGVGKTGKLLQRYIFSAIR